MATNKWILLFATSACLLIAFIVAIPYANLDPHRRKFDKVEKGMTLQAVKDAFGRSPDLFINGKMNACSYDNYVCYWNGSGGNARIDFDQYKRVTKKTWDVDPWAFQRRLHRFLGWEFEEPIR